MAFQLLPWSSFSFASTCAVPHRQAEAECLHPWALAWPWIWERLCALSLCSASVPSAHPSCGRVVCVQSSSSCGDILIYKAAAGERFQRELAGLAIGRSILDQGMNSSSYGCGVQPGRTIESRGRPGCEQARAHAEQNISNGHKALSRSISRRASREKVENVVESAKITDKQPLA